MPVEIRHAIDRVERRHDRRGIDQGGIAHPGADFGSDRGQARLVAAEHRLSEGDQERAMRDVAVTRGAGEQRQIVVLAFCFAALTEQDRMRGGSIETLIQD